MLSRSEEDHLKAVYALSNAQDHQDRSAGRALTSDIAQRLNTKASSVTDMLKRLADKGHVKHAPYHGVTLTARGRALALQLVRRHRLWETFLVEHLGFGWDEVHDVAEQLEHVASDQLIERLDDYLGRPGFDPHGDPIPDSQGRLRARATKPLHGCQVGETVRIAAVTGTTDALLRLLGGKGLRLGTVLTITEVHPFDGSMDVKLRNAATISLSKDVIGHLRIESA